MMIFISSKVYIRYLLKSAYPCSSPGTLVMRQKTPCISFRWGLLEIWRHRHFDRIEYLLWHGELELLYARYRVQTWQNKYATSLEKADLKGVAQANIVELYVHVHHQKYLLEIYRKDNWQSLGMSDIYSTYIYVQHLRSDISYSKQGARRRDWIVGVI